MVALKTFYTGELFCQVDTTQSKAQLLTNVTKLKGEISKAGLEYGHFDEELLTHIIKKTQIGGSSGAASASSKKAP